MDLETVLRAKDLRVTQPRQAVWDVLQSIDHHLSAGDIAERVHEQDPGINTSSVYRTLTLFSELGIVRESHMGDSGGSQWELTHADTVIHVVCAGCDAVLHHAAPPVETLRRHLVAEGFAPTEIDVRVVGRCAACRSGHAAARDEPAG